MELLKEIKELLKYKILIISPHELVSFIDKCSVLGIGNEISDYTFCNFKIGTNSYLSVVYRKKELAKLPFNDRPIKPYSELKS